MKDLIETALEICEAFSPNQMRQMFTFKNKADKFKAMDSLKNNGMYDGAGISGPYSMASVKKLGKLRGSYRLDMENDKVLYIPLSHESDSIAAMIDSGVDYKVKEIKINNTDAQYAK